MAIRAIVFDLDDTIVIEEATARVSMRAVAGMAGEVDAKRFRRDRARVRTSQLGGGSLLPALLRSGHWPPGRASGPTSTGVRFLARSPRFESSHRSQG